MHYQNLEKLKRLKLFGMARALDELQRLADRGQLDFADQLALLIDREASDRANTALLSRLRQARLRQTACFENLNMKAARGLDKGVIRDLFTCRWIGEHRHLIVTGKTEPDSYCPSFYLLTIPSLFASNFGTAAFAGAEPRLRA